MRISVIGVGYLGAVHAAAMADLVDTDDGGYRLGSVREVDLDSLERLLLLVLHDVGVGDDGAITPVDHAAANAAGTPGWIAPPAPR